MFMIRFILLSLIYIYVVDALGRRLSYVLRVPYVVHFIRPHELCLGATVCEKIARLSRPPSLITIVQSLICL